uniref:Uncharacterized protein n=1 Tax=Pristionchus pacificus TaxID=54126 RepID=A0A2A6B7Z1_PRIPA|eukprot:PDM61984.1 hypothetical protein PRIPAC_51426 [Pristionchus pacificus]
MYLDDYEISDAIAVDEKIARKLFSRIILSNLANKNKETRRKACAPAVPECIVERANFSDRKKLKHLFLF